ncbi:hypothetical protein PHAVU_009G177600 [Phaseolus vulgaris]|uniref:Sugar phosphate transporter domain-containing protein n=1 Tax=Phaseolus vulgaris TaxID=3885 RepID=V7AWV4_PHAVU|nr:hypothetical protein PHAVU_009G177600g [Phaseolus vulgaris]ESW10059.1 hypothetical protein PHAVU_009G177600g [Phaseolus vulgaris]
MQSAAFTLSPSLSLPLRNHSLNSSRPSLPLRLFAKHTEGVNSNVASSTSFLRRSWTLSPSPSSSFKFRPLPPSPPRAAENAVPDSAPAENSQLLKTLQLGALFGLWYLFNIYFNIYNKQVLKAFHFPVTVTLVQFAVGTALVSFMWGLNLYKRPKLSGAMLVAILPLAVVHTLGNLFTNMSLGKVAVSFTHTIKAMEPFFSVILSAMFLGEFPTPWVVGSLVPIVGGVALASVTEASFNWAGFWSAMASNVTNQSRNVLSKKAMVNKEDSLDNITLFSIITVMSFFLLAPVAVFMEGVKFTPAYLQSAGVNVRQLYIRSLLAALCFHAYQQVSYMILQRVSPVTHSVGNCVKRVVVIVSSVIFFQTPVSPVNAFGTAIALAGVFLYSRVKRIKSKPKAT